MRKILLLVAIILIYCFSGYCETAPSLRFNSHGTINIILANKFGIVAVTDSRLTIGDPIEHRQPFDNAQKLFKIDDRTICTIAGWYSDSGPVVGDPADRAAFAPAFMAIPAMMAEYLRRSAGRLSLLSPEEKAKSIATEFSYILNAVVLLDRLAGRQSNSNIIEITVAGFYKTKAYIAQVDLVPPEAGPMSVFLVQPHPVVTVDQELKYVVRGIPDIAEPILEHPEQSGLLSPAMNMYAESKTRNGGESLSQAEMVSVATELEQKTAADPRIEQFVGGPIQIATLTQDKAPQMTVIRDGLPSQLSQTDFIGALPISLLFVVGVTFSDPGHLFNGGIGNVLTPEGRGPIVLAVDFGLADSKQQLDNIFAYKSRFTDCTLMYDGSPRTIFDKSNEVHGGELLLGNNVSGHSAFVRQFHHDFPNVKVVNSWQLPVF